MILKENGRAASWRAASRAVIAMLLSTALATCGGADNAGLTPDGRGGAWNVVVSPTSLTIGQGQTVTATLSIVGKANGAVSLSVVAVTDSVTATLSSPALASSS